MEAGVPLLKKSSNQGWRQFAEEVNRVNYIALPMIVVTVSQYLLRMSPMFMLGHLGELSLSAASIATSLCNVTGFSVLFGMAGAFETLCGQAYGGKQYQRVGTYTYAGILCLFIVCIPVSLLWIYAEKLLILMGQDPIISAEAGRFSILLIPTLFPYAILQSLIRYLQTQSLIFPMLWSSLASLCFQLLLCWAFVFKFNLGNSGAALSVGISNWFNVVLLLLYVKFSPACEKTRASFSKDVFLTMEEFFRFAIPSALMLCLEWWSFEIVILLSGLLPNPQLSTSLLSICLLITSVLCNIPFSFGSAARLVLDAIFYTPQTFIYMIKCIIDVVFHVPNSTLLANELGAGNPEAAKVTMWAVLVLSAAEFLIASIAIFICRRILGYVFSGEKEVVDGINDMVPLLCISIILDGLQAVLSGVARGSGWQHIGAYVNLGSYYLVGIPVSLLLGFILNLKGKGLWSGMVAGLTMQSLSLSLITGLTNWEKQAREARERISACNFSSESQPI